MLLCSDVLAPLCTMIPFATGNVPVALGGVPTSPEMQRRVNSHTELYRRFRDDWKVVHPINVITPAQAKTASPCR
jgi:hypothetical protein